MWPKNLIFRIEQKHATNNIVFMLNVTVRGVWTSDVAGSVVLFCSMTALDQHRDEQK